ncbi:hypothetical protein PR048_014437 [Dryococelus australis]|uniref:Uncharacterized protein n=1 Tax=Dryococelus australis TaxID=614101 RepID=A0ABQ9HEF2_9NEOP|nr:hypothetical protein PR048_014437 [Dryococelus australis]
MSLVGGFSRGSPVSHAPPFQRHSILNSVTLIGSQNLAEGGGRVRLFVWAPVVVRLLASHLREPGSIPGGLGPGFSHVGIVPDDAAGRRAFSGISRFPHPCIPRQLLTHLASPASALKTSLFRAAQISSAIHSPLDKVYR